MDNLTHAAIGLLLSRAGLNRWTPLATPILVLAANAPDIDIVTAAGGSLTYLHFHRHLTHSLIAMPIMALLPVALVRLVWRKPVRWLGAFLASMVAVATHLALDLTNVYGIRLLLPFSEKWMRLDLTSVVDIWIWAALLFCLAGPFIARLVGSEIMSGAARKGPYGRGFAIFGLAFVLFYNCARSALHGRAVAALESRVYEESVPARVVAAPDPANPLRWRGVVETSGFFAVEELNLAGNFDPTRATIFHKPEADPALETAQRTRTFQEFLRFSQLPLWRVTPLAEIEGAKRVEVIDMRFGTPLAPGFVASAVVDAAQRVVQTSFQFGRLRPR